MLAQQINQGVFATQNLLYSKYPTPHGVCATLTQRAALLTSNSVTKIASALHRHTWSTGASFNVAAQGRLANLEIFHDQVSVVWVARNYSHVNMYKHANLTGGVADVPNQSSLHRQVRLDQLPPPVSWRDIARALSDTVDKEYPLYRSITLTTVIFDAASGLIQSWDGQPAHNEQPPTHRWILTK